MITATETNSKVSRVQPAFSWLTSNAGVEWPQQLVNIAEGLRMRPVCGALTRVYLDPEKGVPATPQRLAWMLRNASGLAPQNGRLWQSLGKRTADRTAVAAALNRLDAGIVVGLPAELKLEGSTRADGLLECEKALVWIEGKRFDWLSPSTKWDVSRDQLARNLEAVWSLAQRSGKDYCVIICHEHTLKHHEAALVEGYRTGNWRAGIPHIPDSVRTDFSRRIGTLTWSRIASEWPSMRGVGELSDLPV